MKKFVAPNDIYSMNWVGGNTEWGTVHAPASIKVDRIENHGNGIYFERYTFTNTSEVPVFTGLKDISIYTPFNDDYCGAAECTVRRCHTHIFCGGEVAYVCALRMGGAAPHLGLVLTEGSLGGYSVERDVERMSNDRGDFLLHPSPAVLEPGESFSVAWKLFWHEGKEDFFAKLPVLNPNYIQIKAKQFVIFSDEMVCIMVTPAFSFSVDEAVIRRNGGEVSVRMEGNTLIIEETLPEPGEYCYQIEVKGHKTFCRIMVMPPFETLVEKRAHFIVDKQQFHCKGSRLDGAFLIYDREEDHLYYSPENDYNGGRERVAMGILLARFLQKKQSPKLEDSLKEYLTYLEREIYDKEHNLVCNDIGYNDTYKRLYNYPWVSLFYLELYDLYKNKEFLVNAYYILYSFYQQGGSQFYAIEIPLERIMRTLKRERCNAEYEKLMDCFIRHCDTILENDILYPPHEVNFEQSIVAPAADLLTQMYLLTGEEKYRLGAVRQIKILELFQFPIPDYHQYEVAIRHWDGYWFGKKRQYGDTYPHYWSSLSGNVYRNYARLLRISDCSKECYETEKQIYLYESRAESSVRGVLPLFFGDGGASCAYVFPKLVNGEAADRYDVFVNDQDWGLYFYLRSHEEKNEKHRER